MSKNPFLPKFSVLEESIKNKLLEQAKEIGAFNTAKENHKQVGMSFWGLYGALKKELKPKEEGVTKPQYGNQVKQVPKQHKLTREEKEFLEGLKNGTVGLSETSKFVAVRVFENMLKNPHEWAYQDFFRTELLRIKNEETQIKDQWAKEIIGKFFAGKLPPRNCPNCGHSFASSDKVINGELISESKLSPNI